MDFGALPPEINSARIYSGPGSGSMLAAGQAWDSLAKELNSSAAAYRSVIANLSVDAWRGPSSIAMADAAAPYVAWLHTTAAEAEQSATQARTAAATYQSAFAAVVPPPLITANRTQFASLTQSNFFGQNSPAIAATEAAYEEMWAQDAQAMYTYAGSSAAAARLTPFSEPPQTTSSAGAAQNAAATQAAGTPAVNQAQAASSQQLLSQVSSSLQRLAAPAAADPAADLGFTPADVVALGVDSGSATASITSSSFSGSSIGVTTNAIGIAAARDASQGIGPFLAGSPPPSPPTGSADLSASLGSSPVSAAAGRASLVGTLSVPQTWAATATPPVSPAALAVPGTGGGAVPVASTGMSSGMFGEALLGTLAGRGVSNVAAKLRTPSVIPRSPSAG
jgi:PPE-repeat protein